MFMKRYAIFFPILLFLITLLVPQVTMSQKASPTIVNFGARPLYRAVKLTWKRVPNLEKQLSAQILRADALRQVLIRNWMWQILSPARTVMSISINAWELNQSTITKLVIKETGESFGPDYVRPLFRLLLLNFNHRSRLIRS